MLKSDISGRIKQCIIALNSGLWGLQGARGEREDSLSKSMSDKENCRIIESNITV